MFWHLFNQCKEIKFTFLVILTLELHSPQNPTLQHRRSVEETLRKLQTLWDEFLHQECRCSYCEVFVHLVPTGPIRKTPLKLCLHQRKTLLFFNEKNTKKRKKLQPHPFKLGFWGHHHRHVHRHDKGLRVGLAPICDSQVQGACVKMWF